MTLANKTPVALTIAGSDSSGGAGIQADLKTFGALGVYGASAITAITAQNTLGVEGVTPVASAWVKRQVEAVLSDLRVGAIKTGMLYDEKILSSVFRQLSANRIPVVVDPVMIATSGQRLLSKKAVSALKKHAFPRAQLLTPNLLEAAALLECKQATNLDEMEQQAKALLKLGCKAVLIKGGHLSESISADILLGKKLCQRFEYEKQLTANTHGTGCTLSAAVAAYLAQGAEMKLAVRMAHEYLQDAIMQADALHISKKMNKGRHGPVHHLYRVW